ncbi:MAG: glycosyltransferase family 39 protein [Elusimicrobia bacterium]|nr:glycosyltransferase family 39 protein [Elusimicrobiota bacterium]
MKWFFIFSWICFVYIFFTVNTFPHFFNLYKSQIHKIIKQFSNDKNLQKSKDFSPANSPKKTTNTTPAPLEKKIEQYAPTEKKNEPLFHAFQLGIWFWIMINSYLVGKEALDRFKLNDVKNHFVISIALGLGFYSYSLLALGLTGMLLKNVLFFILIISSLMFFKNLRTLKIELKSIFAKFPRKGAQLYLFLPIAGIILAMLLRSFIPDQFYDSLQYHMALPQSYINHHKIFKIPYNCHFGMPQNTEMLFTLGLLLGGDDTIPLLFQLACGILILITLINESNQGSFLAALLWLTTPLVIENLRFTKTDLFLSLYITLAFFLIINWKIQDINYKNLILSGIFAGFALGTKYTGIFFLGFLSIILYLKMKGLEISKKIKLLIIFFSVSLIPFLPWLMKNVLFLKNPFYPFFQNIFGYQMMRPENWTVFVNENHQFYNSFLNLTSIPKFLWRNTFFGFEYPSMNFIGPLWFAFLPLLIFFSYKISKLKPFLIFILFTVIIGSTQTTLARYFFLPILALLSFVLIHTLFSIENIFLKKTLTTLLLFGILIQSIGCLPFLEQVSFGRRAFFGLNKEKKSQLYPEGYFASVEWVNSNLSQEKKLLFIGETKSHLFKVPCIAPSAHNEHLISILLQNTETGDELYKKLNDLRITHILFNSNEFLRLKNYPMFYLNSEQVNSLINFWEKHLSLKYQNNSTSIYELVEYKDGLSTAPEEIKKILLKLNTFNLADAHSKINGI